MGLIQRIKESRRRANAWAETAPWDPVWRARHFTEGYKKDLLEFIETTDLRDDTTQAIERDARLCRAINRASTRIARTAYIAVLWCDALNVVMQAAQAKCRTELARREQSVR